MNIKTVLSDEPIGQARVIRAPAGERCLQILLVDAAVETAERNAYDLLISDVGLPDGTGLELMLRPGGISNIRGIAISGFGMNGDIEKSIQAGFSEHVVNPENLEKLEAAIERVMTNAPAAR